MSADVLAFLIALSASLLLTVPVRALAIRVGMVDLPGPRKVHLEPIPLLGGLAIYSAVMIAIFSAFDGSARQQSIGIVTGATLVAAVGFMDDRGWLHHQVKLFIGMPLAAVMLLASGVHTNVFGTLVGGSAGYWLDAGELAMIRAEKSQAAAEPAAISTEVIRYIYRLRTAER